MSGEIKHEVDGKSADAPRSSRWLYWLWAIVAVVVGLSVWMHLAERRTPTDYYIPHTYRGWVILMEKIPGGEPKTILNGRVQYRIPDTGVLILDHALEYGFASDRFYTIKNDSETTLITWRSDDVMIESQTVVNVKLPDISPVKYGFGTFFIASRIEPDTTITEKEALRRAVQMASDRNKP